MTTAGETNHQQAADDSDDQHNTDDEQEITVLIARAGRCGITIGL